MIYKYSQHRLARGQAIFLSQGGRPLLPRAKDTAIPQWDPMEYEAESFVKVGSLHIKGTLHSEELDESPGDAGVPASGMPFTGRTN